MKTGKKASVKAIKFAQKLTSERLSLNSSWETVTGIILDARQLGISIYTHCERDGDYTDLSLTRENSDSQQNDYNWKIPNSECWDEKECDLEWNYIYKFIAEHLMKTRKSRQSRQTEKTIKNAAKSTDIIDVTGLMKDVALLRTKIKDSTGREKRQLIEEYNQKSKILDAQMERNTQIIDSKKQAKTRSDIQEPVSIDEARHEKNVLYMRMRGHRKRGKAINPADENRYNYLIEWIKNHK